MYVPEIVVGVVMGVVVTIAVIVIAALVYGKKSKKGGKH